MRQPTLAARPGLSATGRKTLALYLLACAL